MKSIFSSMSKFERNAINSSQDVVQKLNIGHLGFIKGEKAVSNPKLQGIPKDKYEGLTTLGTSEIEKNQAKLETYRNGS